jgi:predicted bacteriocin transport accessory protein
MKKKSKIIVLVVIIVLLLGVIGFMSFKDSFKFSEEYNVSKFNKFSYKSLSDVFDMLNDKKSGIVFFCYSGNSWCKEYAKVLNDVSSDNGAKVYYVDIKNDMDNKSDSYNKLVSLLENRLYKDINGTEVLYVPYLMFFKDGVITSYDNETSLVVGEVNASTYWTNDAIKNFNSRFKSFYENIK